jgi:hypothetical protein
MFRKLTVIICLLTFCPMAVGAQELITIANSQIATDLPVADNNPQNKDLKSSSPISMYPANIVIVAESQNGFDVEKVTEKNKEKKSGITFNEWAEIHWGDYRWVWWAGAAGALIALHAIVLSDHK